MRGLRRAAKLSAMRRMRAGSGIDAARKRFGYDASHLVLMHHGILHPNKGNDRILRSLAKLRPALPQLRYLLVGDGAEMANLRALAKELAIEDIVQFTGWLPKLSDVNEAINAGDIGLVMLRILAAAVSVTGSRRTIAGRE